MKSIISSIYRHAYIISVLKVNMLHLSLNIGHVLSVIPNSLLNQEAHPGTILVYMLINCPQRVVNYFRTNVILHSLRYVLSIICISPFTPWINDPNKWEILEAEFSRKYLKGTIRLMDG